MSSSQILTDRSTFLSVTLILFAVTAAIVIVFAAAGLSTQQALPLILPAFLAGILTFLAPCTLPLVPAYLGFISGVSMADLQDPAKAKSLRWRIFLNGLFYVIGFSLIFVLFGSLLGLLGSALAPWRLWLARVGGVFVILFGLMMLNVIKTPFLQQEHRVGLPAVFKRGRSLNSFLLGSAFAFGWTPCVGPVLGSVLLLASASATVVSGALLLGMFSAGLAVPFLIIALLAGSTSLKISKFSKYLNVISVVGGLFLISLGILLLTGNMGLLISYGYRIFEFINYDRLLDYL